MEQELTYKTIAIIGCGAAGGFASVLLCKNPYAKVTAYDTKDAFQSLLPTGGGRCNITYDENDTREFVKNYPRGEKFLLSVFSKLNVQKTKGLFKDLGIKTYTQEDKRVFPISNSSQKTIAQLQKHLESNNFSLVKEKVTKIIKKEEKFIVKTDFSEKEYDFVIITTGGKGNGSELAKMLGHNIVEQKPSLTAIDIEEKFLYKLSGLSFKNIEGKIITKNKNKYPICYGDMLFTHKSISGPCIFKLSAHSAYESFPFEIELKLTDKTNEEIEEEIKNNSKKTIKNVFSKFAPESYITEILNKNNIDANKQSAQINKKEKEILVNSLLRLKLKVINKIKDSEIVTAGGVDLNEINSKTMESKLVKGLFFAGEILNIDGYTGGFNLQNCWSTAYIATTNFN